MTYFPHVELLLHTKSLLFSKFRNILAIQQSKELLYMQYIALASILYLLDNKGIENHLKGRDVYKINQF